MAALTTQLLVNAGTAPTFGAAAVSDTVEVGNGANTFVVYRNTGAAAVEVEVVVPGNTTYGVATPNPTFALADGSTTPTEVWIPLRREYTDSAVAGVGRATITADVVTDLEVAVVRVG